MIIVRLLGALGNQMFQYATARQLSLLDNSVIYFDISGFKKFGDQMRVDNFNIKGDILNPTTKKWLFGHTNINRYREDEKRFNKEIFELYQNKYLNGYWQNEKYFRNIRSDLLEEFTPKKEITSKKYKSLLKDIKSEESVAIHIRHYVKDLDYYIQCDDKYYKKALQIMSNKLDNPKFYVFSPPAKDKYASGREWSKHFMKNGFTYVDIDTEEYIDLMLMKECKHFIIPNSTFGWWGAWLSNHGNKTVITPKKWIIPEKINRRVPKEWTTI